MTGYPSYQSADPAPTEYNKIKVGVKTLDDAVIKFGDQNAIIQCLRIRV